MNRRGENVTVFRRKEEEYFVNTFFNIATSTLLSEKKHLADEDSTLSKGLPRKRFVMF